MKYVNTYSLVSVIFSSSAFPSLRSIFYFHSLLSLVCPLPIPFCFIFLVMYSLYCLFGIPLGLLAPTAGTASSLQRYSPHSLPNHFKVFTTPAASTIEPFPILFPLFFTSTTVPLHFRFIFWRFRHWPCLIIVYCGSQLTWKPFLLPYSLSFYHTSLLKLLFSSVNDSKLMAYFPFQSSAFRDIGVEILKPFH